MPSRSFGSKKIAIAEHLLRSGYGKELADLRSDVEQAFLNVELEGDAKDGFVRPHANTLVSSALDMPVWRVSAPTLAPAIRKFAADSSVDGTRKLICINSDSRAPAEAYLELPFTIPTGVTTIQLQLDEVQLPNGVVSSPDLSLQLYDTTGLTQISSTAFTPTTTSTDVTTADITVVPGTEYKVRVYLGTGAQFVCGNFRVCPTTSSDSFWTSGFLRLEVDDRVLQDSNEVGYANPRFALQSEFSRIDILTSSNDVRLEVYDNIGEYTIGHDELNVVVDDSPVDPPLIPTIGGVSYLTASLTRLDRPMHRLTIYGGTQAYTGLPTPVLENRGTFVNGVYVKSTEVLVATSPVGIASCETIVIYGDSKLSGFYTDVPARDSLAFMLRKRGHRVICETFGGRALSIDVGTTLTVAACTPFAMKLCRHAPTQIIMGIGRNDYVGGTFTPAHLVTQIGNLIDAIHAQSPNTKVKILTWTRESTEVTVGGVSWETERANLSALATSRSTYCSVLEGGRMWSVAEASDYTADTVHPNSLGNERLDRLISAEGLPWSPLQVTSPLIWCEADIGLQGGAALSAVTPGGTSPPTVTLTGTPVSVFNVRLEVTGSGTLGIALFRWSIDGGRSWAERNVVTAASVVLGPTGITANFASGTYSNDNTYTADARIGGWADLSGNGNDLTQSIALDQPLFVASGINRKQTVQCTPVQFLHKTLTIPTPFTVAAVAVAAAQSSLQTLFGAGAPAATSPIFYASSATEMAVVAGGQQQAVTVDATTSHVYIATIIGGGTAGSAVWVDGVKTIFSVPPASMTISDLGIGFDYGNTIAWDKWISAVFVAGSVLSDDEAKSLTAMWRAKYNTP